MTLTPATGMCRFPGCDRPVAPSPATGRPSVYCEDPDHTRILAFKARRAEPVGNDPLGEDLAHPVTAAGARAGSLRDELVKLTSDLTIRLEQVMRELATTSDPDQVAAEIETVRSEAAERVASAEADAARARAAERLAVEGRIKARADRVEAVGVAEDLEAELAAVTTAQADTLLALEGVRVELTAANAANTVLAADLTQVTGERDQQATRAEDLDRELTDAREQTASALTAATRLQAQLEQAHDRTAEITARVAAADTARVEADRARVAAVTEVAALKATLAGAQERVVDLLADVARQTTATLAATERAAGAEARVEAAAKAAADVAKASGRRPGLPGPT